MIACVTVPLVAGACGTAQMTPATTVNRLPSTSKPLPVVVTSATPAGWVPVDYLGAQISVPADYAVAYGLTAACASISDPGTVLVAPTYGEPNCPMERAPKHPATVVRIEALSSVAIEPYSRSIVVNGITVRVAYPGPSPSLAYDDVPSLGVRLTTEGRSARRILTTLTRSPRTLVLAPGPAPAVPTTWHTLTFQGLSFAVPSSWPVTQTNITAQALWPFCSSRFAVALPTAAVTLSTDTGVFLPSCPAPALFGGPPMSPSNGVEIDARFDLSEKTLTTFSTRCLKVHALIACPATSPAYSVLVVRVTVPGRAAPLFVSIGLAGNGMVARTILYSLRAAPRTTPPTSTTQISLGACRSGTISMSDHLGYLAAGNSYLIFVLTNNGSTGCSVAGVPKLTVESDAGTPIYTPKQQGATNQITSAVAPSPGGSASFWVDFLGCHSVASSVQPFDARLVASVDGLPSGVSIAWASRPLCAAEQLAISAVAAGKNLKIP